MDEKATGTVFRDVLTLALAGFVATVLIVLPHVNPPNSGEGDSDAPGNVIFEMTWPDEMDVDIDLWVQAPGDIPVGYSNLSGMLTNLLRDDLGHYRDPMPVNFENAYTRGIPPGEYVVNVHFFSNHGGFSKIPVTVQAAVKPDGQKRRQIATTGVDMFFVGQETTVFRFSLTADGELVPGSINHLQKALRPAQVTR